MKTFIKVTEIWVPNKEHTHLVLKEGTYGDYQHFKKISQQKQFAYRSGLPGKVWSSGLPIILKDLENTYFERSGEAHKVGLTCAIGFPVFSGEFLMAVIVFLCGDDKDHAGAIEIWSNQPDSLDELQLINGYYGTLKHFAGISVDTKIGKGTGLPGLVWARNRPVLIDDIGHSTEFIRAHEALQAGISTGIGIPVNRGVGKFHTLVFLSAKATPIAKRMQVWVPGEQHEKLYCHDAYGSKNDSLAEMFETKTISKGEDIIGKVWLTGVPTIVESNFNGQLQDPAGISALLAIPVIDKGILTAVVTFMF